MRSHISRTLAVVVAGFVLATSAQAQGNGHGKDKGKAGKIKRDEDRRVVVRESNGEIIRNGEIVRIDRGRKIPPGLAKKPGQMPPGQYKKLYNSYDGANVLGDIFRRRGYTVVRTVPNGDARYVYYRYGNGLEQRAIVRPGTDRLLFSNVPSSVLQAVLSYLY
jgi:ribosomal protein L27